MTRHVDNTERGAALITVLVIVAAMATVAVGLTQTVTASTQRARALDTQAQLRMYTVAAENLATARLGSILQATQGRLTLQTPGMAEAQTFPIDDGVVRVRLRDDSNCYDLNQLVIAGEQGEQVGAADQAETLTHLFEAAEIDNRDAMLLVASLTDWMDSDSSLSVSGAEDSFYADESPAYRTAQRPLVSVSELRAVRGYTPEIMDVLRPLVCARAVQRSEKSQVLNINTLQESQAPLLVQHLSDAIDPDEAQRLIASRPPLGWPDLEAFLAEPAIANIDPNLRDEQRFGLTSSHVTVLTEIAYRGSVVTMAFDYSVSPELRVRLTGRRRVS